MTKKFKIGDLKLVVQGQNALAEELCHYFLYCEDDTWDGNADLRIVISDTEVLKEQTFYSLSGKFGFSENEIQKRDAMINYHIEGLFAENEETVISIFLKKKDSIHSRITRSLTGYQVGLNSFEAQCVDNLMIYSFFWYILPVVMLKSQMAFVHSSISVYNGKGIAVVGTGGCGKTSFELKLLEDASSKYVSEDFGIVSSKGKAFYNPKYVSIYQSDIAYGQKDLVKLKNNMKLQQKIQWAFSVMRNENPIVRVSAIDLLGQDRIAQVCEIENAVYFARSKEKKVKIEQISAKEMAKRATRASFRELSYLYELMMNAEAVCAGNLEIPTMEELIRKQEEILEQAFSHTRNYLVVVPLKAGPQEIFEKLRSIIE